MARKKHSCASCLRLPSPAAAAALVQKICKLSIQLRVAQNVDRHRSFPDMICHFWEAATAASGSCCCWFCVLSSGQAAGTAWAEVTKEKWKSALSNYATKAAAAGAVLGWQRSEACIIKGVSLSLSHSRLATCCLIMALIYIIYMTQHTQLVGLCRKSSSGEGESQKDSALRIVARGSCAWPSDRERVRSWEKGLEREREWEEEEKKDAAERGKDRKRRLQNEVELVREEERSSWTRRL